MRATIISLLILLTMSLSAQTKPETKVLIKTSYGNITAILYNDTPQHRDNFIKLVKEGWYNGSPFHRVIKNFMIQGGGSKAGQDDPGYTVPAEFKANHIHTKGALAAARLPDQANPKKASSGSQFYIVQGQKYDEANLLGIAKRTGVKYTPEQLKAYAAKGGTPHLDGSYTVFGEVIDGFDVIDKIAAVKTAPGDKPIQPVTMTIEILK
jgi:cyclophilin family peptidyl-prolyl cis-trans isomerase